MKIRPPLPPPPPTPPTSSSWSNVLASRQPLAPKPALVEQLTRVVNGGNENKREINILKHCETVIMNGVPEAAERHSVATMWMKTSSSSSFPPQPPPHPPQRCWRSGEIEEAHSFAMQPVRHPGTSSSSTSSSSSSTLLRSSARELPPLHLHLLLLPVKWQLQPGEFHSHEKHESAR